MATVFISQGVGQPIIVESLIDKFRGILSGQELVRDNKSKGGDNEKITW